MSGGKRPPDELAAYFNLKAQRKRLTRRICRNPRWWSLTVKRRLSILRDPESGIVKPRYRIAESAGIDFFYYRLAYSYFSNFAHCGPIPISYAALGPEAEDEKYMNLSMGLEYGIWMGCFAIRGVVDLFPDAYVIIHSRVSELDSQWKDILREFK
jgi:hypothetical protein